jgi:hypothetical protein
MRRSREWRGPEANRRHHDFQAAGTGRLRGRKPHRNAVLEDLRVAAVPRIRVDPDGFRTPRAAGVQSPGPPSRPHTGRPPGPSAIYRSHAKARAEPAGLSPRGWSGPPRLCLCRRPACEGCRRAPSGRPQRHSRSCCWHRPERAEPGGGGAVLAVVSHRAAISTHAGQQSAPHSGKRMSVAALRALADSRR